MDPHMALCLYEHSEPEAMPCTECGDESEGFSEWCDGSGFICEPCCVKDENEEE